MPPTKRHQIELGDGTRKWFLRFTTRSIGQLEEELGQPLQLTMNAASLMSIKALSGLIWAGLQSDEKGKELTRDQVIDMMDLKLLKTYITICARAVVADTGMVEDLPASMREELFKEDGEELEKQLGKEGAATEDTSGEDQGKAPAPEG